eukprot:scaffold447_cov112-Skeletonema_dohrnii-CCMP3373.AAC.3
MPKVVPTAKSPPEEVAEAEVAVDDVEVPPLPPILPPNDNDDEDDGKIVAMAAEGEEGIVQLANAEAAGEPAAKDEDNNLEQPIFYAVRVGYAACPSCSSSKADDAAALTSATPSGNGCNHVSTIRSAIFLRWQDVQQFVEFQEASPAAASANGVVNVPFHHNVEYKEFTDMERALKYLQQVTPPSTNKQWWKIRSLPRPKVSNMPIQPPVKNFNPPTKKWESMYQASLQFKAIHGHINILTADASTEDEKELLKWVKYQRTSYKAYLEDPMGRNHSMTSTKVYRLKEAGFDWIVEDKRKWLSEGTMPTSDTGKRKRGRPRKSETSTSEERLKKKHRKDEEDRKKARPIRQKWLEMHESLRQYKAAHGTVKILDDDNSEEHKELKLWVKAQKANYIRWNAGADVGMTSEKAELLTELGVEFAPSWDEMFAQVVAYKSQHGHINVTSEENAELASWMVKQNHVLGRHLMGMTTRLKKEQISRLMNVGFEGGRTKFVSGDGRIEGDYKNENVSVMLCLYAVLVLHGHCNVPTSAGTDLSNWVAAQRRMYGKLISGKPGKRSFLDASKMQRLTDLGFQFRPRGSYYSWEEQMVELKKYKEETGDCKIPVNHERLGSFVKLVRRDYKKYVQGKKCGMTAAREAELQALGFVFEGGKTPERKVTQPKSWEERYQDLIRYKEQNGDTIVPQNSGRLGQWVHAQRVHYKKFKKGEQSQMTAEKALKLSEIGFCFDAAERFRGSRISTMQRPLETAEEVQVQIPDVPPALGGSFY